MIKPLGMICEKKIQWIVLENRSMLPWSWEWWEKTEWKGLQRNFCNNRNACICQNSLEMCIFYFMEIISIESWLTTPGIILILLITLQTLLLTIFCLIFMAFVYIFVHLIIDFVVFCKKKKRTEPQIKIVNTQMTDICYSPFSPY